MFPYTFPYTFEELVIVPDPDRTVTVNSYLRSVTVAAYPRTVVL